MIRFAVAIAAAVVSASAAFAGDVYDFKIGGQSIHIEQPRNCNSPSCATISIPGIYESGPKRKRAREADDNQAAVGSDKKDINTKPAPTDAAPAPATQVAPSVATAPAEKSLEPANGVSTPPPAPAATGGGLAAPTVATIQPAPAPIATSVASTPLGVWLTEEKEGKVRIENCGGSLCGYSVDAKTNANGDKVLINMKPSNNKWSGKIHDPKSGSSYDSTIALNGNDRLRVQGCAFGGMFCGGQTWTRVN